MPILLLLLTLAQPAPPPVDVRMVTDEADAALHILGKKGQGVTEEDWQRLFSSEGYVRLKKRDTQMGRPFEDAGFRTFVLSEDLAKRAPDLTRTLGLWTAVDPSAAGRRALAYLPAGAHIRARIYPVLSAASPCGFRYPAVLIRHPPRSGDVPPGSGGGPPRSGESPPGLVGSTPQRAEGPREGAERPPRVGDGPR